MKNLVLIMTMLLVLSNISATQTSISYKDKKNIGPTLSYRLPTWGYSTLFLNINGGTDYSVRNTIYHKNTTSLYALNLVPVLRGYHESEQFTENYNLSCTFSNQFDRANSQYFDGTARQRINQRERYISEYSFAGSLQRYIHKNVFFNLNGTSFGTYQNYYYKDQDQDKTEHNKSFRINLNPGIGFGRIRNVTPVLRALRLQERCKALNSGLSIEDDEIEMLAQEIAKISGYEVIYQREARYFWQNVLKQAENISTVTPYEVHYLTDILKESIGTRYEGWNITIGLQTSKPDKAKWILGGHSQLNWYKNFSLEHQIQLTLYGTYLKYPDEKYDGEERMMFGMHINYLWLLTDRIFWNSLLGSRWASDEFKDNRSIFVNLYKLESSLIFYIENGFNFNINLLLELDKRKEKYDINPENNITYRGSELTFGFTYYFDRRLF
ncbi:hypothetical protein JW964_18305 [candidate division KSB1 bacterium]|nr:hypothetical protein [candidate division KSB1 bacterium]